MRKGTISGSELPRAISDPLQLLTTADPSSRENIWRFDKHLNALHLAIMTQPYLDYVLEGKKTIESRFSIHRYAPYNQIMKGDTILLKEPGGPVIGLCEVADAWFYRLSSKSWKLIENEFFREICVDDPQFWRERRSATYATLIRVIRARRIIPTRFQKRDRRSWVVLIPFHAQRNLNQGDKDS